ncbi:ankyrin repeat protein [Emericellopsis atlantica]|uniref:non-specific serine/threonine protein kinase n=1 Tax=Emericellopsis atlantica TaxID=2614577 RepID=A0A9P7ZGW7_9HYPO|nr:ankyrin repeat protein [Emericellopsis atlantica]KAG9251899.1 ankyrin repeat protein [Emericellopsis atlantica]
MDRVPGFPLDAIRLAFQMRGIVKRLQSITSNLARSLVTGECRSFYLEDSFGLPPKASREQIDAFINFWANYILIGRELKKTIMEDSVCPDVKVSTHTPLVFVHHDLAPRNIILDPNGRFYPRLFEYASMHNFHSSAWDRFAIWRWKLFTFVAGGLFHKEARWLEIARWQFTRSQYARRFNVKAKDYASVASRPDTE